MRLPSFFHKPFAHKSLPPMKPLAAQNANVNLTPSPDGEGKPLVTVTYDKDEVSLAELQKTVDDARAVAKEHDTNVKDVKGS